MRYPNLDMFLCSVVNQSYLLKDKVPNRLADLLQL
jgi:hypothetical protein